MAATRDQLAHAIDLARSGRLAEARDVADGVLRAEPGNVSALLISASALRELGDPAAACDAARRAAALAPTNPQAHRALGEALEALGDGEGAVASYGRAVELGLDRPALQLRLGQLLRELGRFAAAAAAFDRAATLAPEDPRPRFSRSFLRLQAQDWAGGWADHEARLALPDFRQSSNGFLTERVLPRLATFPMPETFEGQEVLVVGEQGVGDQLMHLSMLPDLEARARGVTWVCDRRLHRLMADSHPATRFADPRDGAVGGADDFGVIVAAGSLGHAFRRKPEDFTGQPFARPPAALVASWRERLGASGRRRVGLSWRGGLAQTGQARRSLQLTTLAPLLARPDTEVVSLQYGDTTAELAQARADLGVHIRAFSPAEIDDFADLAALAANLDVVVSVQTALVHLCGAIGQPCLALIPALPEWRYGTEGETMPWYRSVQLLRQDAPGDWSGVVAEVLRRLP